jgi:hypothetical protein
MGSDPAAPPLSGEETRSWQGRELDDVAGVPVGRVGGIYVDAESGAPAWLVVSLGRRRRATWTVVPARECAAMPGRVWTAQGREAIKGAAQVDPTRPLLREHETAICAHYGIGVRVGRHAEVAGRAEGAVTARPA